MADRTDFLIFARRTHDVLRHASWYGDTVGNDTHFEAEQPRIAHHMCTLYLTGVMSYLEGIYGERSWDKSGTEYTDFDEYIKNDKDTSTFKAASVSKNMLDALVCIRNAVIHNEGDLSKNHDKDSFKKVKAEAIIGVNLDGGKITLASIQGTDFMEQVRQALIAVAMYHGDG